MSEGQSLAVAYAFLTSLLIQAEDRVSIEREMTRRIDPTSATRLNSDGNKLLNLYAAAGLTIIQDQVMPPSTIEELLVAYNRF